MKCKNVDNEYLNIVDKILNNGEFLKRKQYKHHGKISVFDHSLRVSVLAYKFSKKFKKMDYKSVAIGTLLHDFYYNPWTENKEKKPFFKKHGFVHAKEALENSKQIFPEYMNEKIEDIIEKHMFPLNIRIPKYKETWVIILIDKLVSLEVFAQPKFFLNLLYSKKRSNNIKDKNIQSIDNN